MNESQEVILDQLMIAKEIGTNWLDPDPLRLAVEALHTGGLSHQKEIGRALGFPLAFCQAIKGASDIFFPSVDDLRALAISVFSEVSPRENQPKYTNCDLVATAFWCARQAYLAHDRPNKLCEEATELLESYLAKPINSITASVLNLLGRISRIYWRVKLDDTADFHPDRLLLNAFHFALSAMLVASRDGKVERSTGFACRDTGRFFALVQGLDGAVPFCLDLARVLKLLD